MKTFIRYPGNKSRQLRHIIPHIPEFTGIYIEPFLGSGAVYLHLQPKRAILNDMNTDIINIWNLIKNEPEFIIKEVNAFKKDFLPLSNTQKIESCKKYMSILNKLPVKKRIVMYLILTYCSFKGTIITNNKYMVDGLYISLYKYNTCHLFTEEYKSKLYELKKFLQETNTKIYNKDYADILKIAKKGDFVFLDPPYIEDKAYSFQYNLQESFNTEELKKQVDKLTKKGIKWVMTQTDSAIVNRLFKDYKIIKYNRNTGFQGISSGKKELIIKNF